MPRIISNDPTFQKLGIEINANMIEGGRVLAIDVFAPRAGWEMSFRKGPVVGFKAGLESVTPEHVFEGLSHFLVQHVRVIDQKDVTERIEDVAQAQPEPEPEEFEADVMKVAEQEISDLHEKNEALTKERDGLKGELDAAEQNVKILREQIVALTPAAPKE